MNPSSTQKKQEPNEQVIINEKITKNGEVTYKKYVKGRVLGKGGFATCYEFTDTETNKILAAKIIPKSSLVKKRALEKLLAEIKIHKSLHHVNIVQFQHVFEDKENVYILLELCPNETLKELLKKRKRISENDVVNYMCQTISAVKYLHSKRVIHRDLKLGNMFLGQNLDIKLGDFGLAAKIEQDGQKRYTICGTPNYIAPEILDKKEGHTYEADTWSIGVICYTLLIGKPPFETSDTKTTYRRIMKCNYSFPSHAPISEDAKDLIKKILVREPSKRPTLDELLEHPFIKNNPNRPNYGSESLNKLTPQKTDQSSNPLPSHRNLNSGIITSTQQLDRKAEDLDKNIDEIEPRQNNHARDRIKTQMMRPSTSEQKIRQYTYTGIAPKQPKQPHPITAGEKEVQEVVQEQEQDCFVTKWVDYSTKYGFGYLLSNGVSGVVFNDSTRITLDPEGLKFEYMEKRHEEKREIISTHSISSAPKDLTKKINLLKHFKGYLEGNDKKDEDKKEEFKSNDKPKSNSQKKNLIYVKKWMKTKYAFMFRLSNRVVQVDFTDKTQIILSPQKQMVYYKNKKDEKTQYPLTTALDEDYPEMVKRLKYAKEILAHVHQQNSDGDGDKGDGKKKDNFLNSIKFGEAGTGKIPQSKPELEQ